MVETNKNNLFLRWERDEDLDNQFSEEVCSGLLFASLGSEHFSSIILS